jgi:hypothetical protein
MVKITDIEPRLKQVGNKTGAKPDGLDKADFDQVLHDASRSGSSDKISLGQASPPQGPSSIYGPSPAVPPEALVRSQAELAADRALDLLDDYQAALADPKRSLKSMAPLIKDLEDEVARLQEGLRNLPADDALRPILSRIAVTSMVETVRFNRGDYN